MMCKIILVAVTCLVLTQVIQATVDTADPELVADCNNICQNGGTLRVNESAVYCACTPFYSGELCETFICQNGGTRLEVVGGGYICRCPLGFYGDHCEKAPDFCGCKPCQNNGTCENLPETYRCRCINGYFGDNCEYGNPPADCSELLKNYGHKTSGIYTIYLGPYKIPTQVYCDMTTDGGGWTLFQRRVDDTLDFYRNWTEYAAGFGDLNTNFYLGNDNLHLLIIRTSGNEYKLRVDLTDWNITANKGYAEYSHFRIGDASQKYYLESVGGYFGSAGDSLSDVRYYRFSTYDNDNDGNSATNCAALRRGAWWYNSCSKSNLNGLYYEGGKGPNMNAAYWETWKGPNHSFKTIEMKVRPANFWEPNKSSKSHVISST